MKFDVPPGLSEADEYLHAPPPGEGLWSDNFWFSVVDRDSDVFGINHIHASRSHGYLRVSAMYVIDGVHQQWASKQPLDRDTDVFTRLGDAKLGFSVEEPFGSYRWVFDGPTFGFDLNYELRFPTFDYDDCLGGNPLAAFEDYGGHYEQALVCTGELEAHAGPRAGERRKIESWAHRDHSWTHRFQAPTHWEQRRKRTVSDSLGHFWPSIQLPDRHINAFGWMRPDQPLPDGVTASGGWIGDANGSRPIKSASCTTRIEDDERTAMSFKMEFEPDQGETFTVLTARKHGQTRNGLMRSENDAEARLDCYEPFFDFEVLETGERGYGVVEY
ncbi:MAG: hypothetical protein KDB69_02535, partial [Acidimicrobiia bacterium]|nr:hypothetical protein [Acidimicrobiia bacterium]